MLFHRLNQLQRSTSVVRQRLRAKLSRTVGGVSGSTAPYSAANSIRSESMDPSVEVLVRRLHDTPHKVVLCVTGGASQAISWLLSVPGASNTVLEVTVPYARDSLISILGKEPEQYCSEQTAMDIAAAAYQRAANLTPFGVPIIGLAATCSLATEPMKRGEHRAYIAAHCGQHVLLTSLHLAKGARSRWGEDDVTSRAVLQVLAAACGMDVCGLELGLQQTQNGSSPQQHDDVQHSRRTLHANALEALLAGRIRCVEFSDGQVIVDAPRSNRVYLSGSFNPVHEGHKQLMQVACDMLSTPDNKVQGCFELSAGNADKGMLSIGELQHRVDQFVAAGMPVLVTSAPLFSAKAQLLPSSTFIIGYDTAARLVMPKYYGGSEEAMAAVFAQFRQLGCRFLVAGRKDNTDGRFHCFEELELPCGAMDLFKGITEDKFRVDLSSTEIRRRSSPF